MSSCKENTLDDLMTITAIPLGDYNIWNNWALQPVIPQGSFHPTMTHAIVINVIKQTGSVKDAENDSVSGRKHTITVNCDVDGRDADIIQSLRTLEYEPRHLILTFRGNTRAFVGCTQDTYVCESERSGSKVSLQFKIDSISGLQLVM